MSAKHPLVLLTCLCVLLFAVVPPRPAAAASRSSDSCEAAARPCVGPSFESFWQANGARAVFGDPLLAEQRIGATLRAQDFDRAQLVASTTNGMIVGQLGDPPTNESLLGSDSLVAKSGALDAFWRDQFAAQAWNYYAPAAVIEFAQPDRPTCGTASLSEQIGPFFCIAADAIYVDRTFLAAVYDALGPIVITTTIAHEWGHHLQMVRGINGDRYTLKQRELQADCFAGVYIAHAVKNGALTAFDADQARMFLRSIGARKAGAEYDPASHGTADQRITAFDVGFAAGVGGCEIDQTTKNTAAPSLDALSAAPQHVHARQAVLDKQRWWVRSE